VSSPGTSRRVRVKTLVYPEYPALLVAAKLTGRPVAWDVDAVGGVSSPTSRRATRSPAWSWRSTRKGNSSPCGVKHIAAMGAYIGIPGANIQTNNFFALPAGMYAIPRIDVGVQCVFTNTVPTGPYRAPAVPRRITRWSGWWKRPRASPASTR